MPTSGKRRLTGAPDNRLNAGLPVIEPTNVPGWSAGRSGTAGATSWPVTVGRRRQPGRANPIEPRLARHSGSRHISPQTLMRFPAASQPPSSLRPDSERHAPPAEPSRTRRRSRSDHVRPRDAAVRHPEDVRAGHSRRSDRALTEWRPSGLRGRSARCAAGHPAGRRGAPSAVNLTRRCEPHPSLWISPSAVNLLVPCEQRNAHDRVS